MGGGECTQRQPGDPVVIMKQGGHGRLRSDRDTHRCTHSRGVPALSGPTDALCNPHPASPLCQANWSSCPRPERILLVSLSQTTKNTRQKQNEKQKHFPDRKLKTKGVRKCGYDGGKRYAGRSHTRRAVSRTSDVCEKQKLKKHPSIFHDHSTCTGSLYAHCLFK